MQVLERNTEVLERNRPERTLSRPHKELRSLFSYILEEKSRFTTGDSAMPGKVADLFEANLLMASPDFNEWQMPAQAAGFIKPRKHDFL
jgi:hypothetical protein